jgi:hypothetical protein
VAVRGLAQEILFHITTFSLDRDILSFQFYPHIWWWEDLQRIVRLLNRSHDY